MVTPILSSVPVCRVRFIRTRLNIDIATLGLKATPTISRLNVPSQHGFIDLEAVSSQTDPDTGVGYLDLVVTDDAQVSENFGWVITGDGWTGFSRTVSVPQDGAAVETVYSDGVEMPAVWLNELADFTGASGPVGSEVATRTYVDDSIELLQTAPDPFQQYALDSDVAGRLVPTGGTEGQVVGKTGGAVAWVTGSGGGDLPEDTGGSGANGAYIANRTATNLLSKTTRYITTSAAISQPLPAATAGRILAVGWDAGANTLTLTAAGSDVIGSGTSTSLVVPLVGEVLALHCTAAGRWRIVSGFKPQAALSRSISGVFDASNYSSIQAAIDDVAASGVGGTVRISKATTITTGLTIPSAVPVSLEALDGVVVTAGASMSAMITKATGGQTSGIFLRNLRLDGAMLAQRALDVEQATNLSIRGGQWNNFTYAVADFSKSGVNKVLGLSIRDLEMRGIDSGRTGATPAQMPAYGLKMGTLATDAVIEDVTIVNVLIGVSDAVGGGTVYDKVHVFGYPYLSATSTNDYLATKGFEILGGICRLTDCYADTQQVGFDLQGSGQNIISNALFYWPADFQHTGDIIGFNVASANNSIIGATIRLPSATGLTGYPIQIQASTAPTIVANCMAYGAGWHAFFNVIGSNNTPVAIGNAWTGGIVPQNLDLGGGAGLFGTGSGVTGAAGATRDLALFSGTSKRWALRADNSAEGGGAAGSAFSLNAFTDAGAFLWNVLTIQRYNGVATFQRAVHRLRTTQSVATNAGIGFDSALSNQHVVALSANVTSSTIGNTSSTGSTTLQPGQEITIAWQQDVTGGRTYVWPTTCRFAGGIAPQDTTANTRTSVTFSYENGLWCETARAVAVPRT